MLSWIFVLYVITLYLSLMWFIEIQTHKKKKCLLGWALYACSSPLSEKAICLNILITRPQNDTGRREQYTLPLLRSKRCVFLLHTVKVPGLDIPSFVAWGCLPFTRAQWALPSLSPEQKPSTEKKKDKKKGWGKRYPESPRSPWETSEVCV